MTPAADPDHRRGSMAVLASAVLFSWSGVLTRAIDAGSWVILTWRGLIGGVAIGLYVLARDRGRPRRRAWGLGARGWTIASVGAVGSVTFIVSFK
ncbi:MAG: EamA family transporter, partial [Actinomycetota bacterium]